METLHLKDIFLLFFSKDALLVLLFVFCIFMIIVFVDDFSDFLGNLYCNKIDKEVNEKINRIINGNGIDKKNK